MNQNRVPKGSSDPLPELAAFLEPFAPLFRRYTSRDSMERYVTGLLTDLPHKTCDSITDVIAGTSVERLQHLLTDAAWDPLQLDEISRQSEITSNIFEYNAAQEIRMLIANVHLKVREALAGTASGDGWHSGT